MHDPVFLRRAVRLLKRGRPLPVDLETQLIAHGIDPMTLRAEYEL